jgi:hypothetical protein
MQKKNLLMGYRIFFALLAFAALITEVAVTRERGTFVPANFFSFFTVESNSLAVIILLVSALAHSKQTRLMAILRGANTMNMIVVGIVFLLLLSGLENAEFTAVPWDNTVLHYIMPIVVAVDWFIDIPKLRIAFRQALSWLLFPAAYAIYSLIRGHFVGWYPYPFLNPSQHGYVSVAATSIVLMFGALGLAWMLTWPTVAKR